MIVCSILREVDVAGPLGVLLGLLLPSETLLTHRAPKGEVCSVGELLCVVKFRHQGGGSLRGLLGDWGIHFKQCDVNLLGGSAERAQRQGVVMEPVVDHKRPFSVPHALPVNVHPLGLDVVRCDLPLVVLGQDRQLDRSSPPHGVENPPAVVAVALLQEHVVVRVRVRGNRARHHLPEVPGFVPVALHDVSHRIEQAGVIRDDHSLHELAPIRQAHPHQVLPFVPVARHWGARRSGVEAPHCRGRCRLVHLRWSRRNVPLVPVSQVHHRAVLQPLHGLQQRHLPRLVEVEQVLVRREPLLTTSHTSHLLDGRPQVAQRRVLRHLHPLQPIPRPHSDDHPTPKRRYGKMPTPSKSPRDENKTKPFRVVLEPVHCLGALPPRPKPLV
mmetsp:Transcript_3735/g.10688  ORF Transcript_3735/g.10688 Transcript_3735/m.10688 type:complete len:385 (-) Transcript_3735:46-1200(-)